MTGNLTHKTGKNRLGRGGPGVGEEGRRSGVTALQAEGTAWAKALGPDCAWGVLGTARSPVCLERSERGGEREEGRAGRGQGRSCRTLWAARETWAFTPREGCGQRKQRRGGT